jgi:hypothetical protein
MYKLLDFMLSGWYSATITLLRGYLTGPDAADYARAHPRNSRPKAAEIDRIHKNVQSKFEIPGTRQRWPKLVEVYEEEWALPRCLNREGVRRACSFCALTSSATSTAL